LGPSKNKERDIITFRNLHYAEGEGKGTEDKYMELDLDLDREGERGGEDVFEKSTTRTIALNHATLKLFAFAFN